MATATARPNLKFVVIIFDDKANEWTVTCTWSTPVRVACKTWGDVLSYLRTL